MGLGTLACGSEDPDTERPNIVVISVDTLNRSALRAFDDSADDHPTLDRFAAAAARFINAHSTASWTLPAHGSLMTGLYPDRHGVPSIHAEPSTARLRRWQAIFGRAATRLLVSRTAGISTQVSALLRALTAGMIGPRIVVPRRAGSSHVTARGPIPEYVGCLTDLLSCSESERHRLASLYAAELHNLDSGFARLLEALEGIAHNTFVLLLSDHGEGFDLRRGRIHHGGRLHEDQVRVPLLVAGPGVAAQNIGMPVSLVDVMPTLMELAGIETTNREGLSCALGFSWTLDCERVLAGGVSR